MKRILVGVTIASVMLMVSGALAVTSRAADEALQQGVVQFDTPVKLGSVLLKGQYLFVHDDVRMARGESCTYVYNYTDGKQGNLVVDFHCIPVERKKVDHFSISTRLLPGVNMYELVEYQFAGSNHGHRVP